jgi:hypothetical protein
LSLLQISEINSELMLPSTTPTTFGGGEGRDAYTPSTLPDPHFYNNGGGHSTPEPYYYGGGGGGRGMQLEERPKSHMLLETDLDQMQAAPPRSKSENLLETNFDYDPYEHHQQQDFLSRANRSKSQPLETAM